MTVHQNVLEELQLTKGQPPMTPGQLQRRIWAYMDREWPKAYRERDNLDYEAWKEEMKPTLTEAEANFIFNFRLNRYRVALERLGRYRLAVGQAAVYEDQPTGEYDAETGEPITESVLVQPEIEPLPAEIEVPVVDEETGEQTGTEMIPNPEIERDDAERAAAQAVVDQTPQPVKAFPVA